MKGPIYEVKAVQHVYRQRTVVDIPHMTVAGGSILGLMGPNGSGKSTLLRLLGFVEKPTRGRILFQGAPAAPFSPRIRFRVTLLSQEPCLMKRSVFHNIAYGLRLRGHRAGVKERVGAALDLVGLPPAHFLKRPWYALSSGEAHRVALAARLALAPEVLLLDEPTAGVDALSAQLIREAFLRARAEGGATLIISSHDPDWLQEVSDETRHLFEGRFLNHTGKNAIFGPWTPGKPGTCEKPLADGQRIIVPEPPAPDAVALIRPYPASSQDPGISSGPSSSVTIRGRVIRLSTARNATHVLVQVSVEGITVSLEVDEAAVRTAGLLPGRDTQIAYRLEEVEWLH